MIARVWDGATEARQGDEYTEYLRRTGVRDLEGTEGNHGVYVLRREDGGRTGFRMISLWESMDAIRQFSGPDPQRARYYPDDGSFLLHMSPGVEHYEVVIGPGDASPAGEAAALAEELRRVRGGDAWHGPSLKEALEGLSAADAARRPIPDAHSIWELVQHVAAWTDTVTRRLDGEPRDEPEAGDFSPVSHPTTGAWARALDDLEETHERLAARVARLTPADLASTVPGRDHPVRVMVRGVLQHVVYHAGQIALLRKAIVTETAPRLG